LERNLSENVALLAITPNSSRREVKIFAEAKTSEDMTNFVKTLAQDEFLTEPLLIKHELEEKDANRPYRFVVETRWREQP
jgi:Tfp pilus assembly protein PilN